MMGFFPPEHFSDERHELVKAAAVYMDGLKPGWWENVDPLTFELRDPCLCVAGQNGIPWDEFWTAVPNEISVVMCEDEDLEYWLDEIARRMSVREPVTA